MALARLTLPCCKVYIIKAAARLQHANNNYEFSVWVSLPENGDLINVPTVIFPVDESDEPDPSTHPEDPYTADLSRTFIPGGRNC